jgi:LysM repeat protein
MKKYKIKTGDTLRALALRFYNDPDKYLLIAEENKINNPDKIEVGQVLKIPDSISESAKDKTLRQKKSLTTKKKFSGLKKFHNAFSDGIRWRLTKEGVETEHVGIERTAGLPKTVTKIWENYYDEINKWAKHFDVPCVLIIATIATESGGKANARREEPGFISDEKTPHRVSVGLMQTLISTARAALNNKNIDAAWLIIPSNSIQAGTSYIAEQYPVTKLDPPKAACAYNAGGVYENKNPNNRWRMRQYPIGTSEHCDRFIKWFNDAVFVLKNHPVKPKVPYNEYFA